MQHNYFKLGVVFASTHNPGRRNEVTKIEFREGVQHLEITSTSFVPSTLSIQQTTFEVPGEEFWKQINSGLYYTQTEWPESYPPLMSAPIEEWQEYNKVYCHD